MDNEFVYSGRDNLETMREARNYNDFLTFLVLNIGLDTGYKILDIGSGVGLYAEILRNKGYHIFCIEPDVLQAELLQQKGFQVYSSVNKIENQIDVMYALNVLEHIEDDVYELSIWKTKLKEKGKLLIYVPAFHILFSSMDSKVKHFRRYTRKLLTQKVTEAGFKIVKPAQYADSLGFFATLIYKLFGSKKGNINTKFLIFYDRFLFPISKICDIFFRKVFGKNVFIIVEK